MESSHTTASMANDLDSESITQHTILTNSQSPNLRLNYVLERLIIHIHAFARETRLSTEEWMAGLMFMTEVGQKCTDVRQEYMLLSDIMGLSLLVDSISHPTPPHSTESSMLGPFHTHDAKKMPNGDLMSHDDKGDPCLVVCHIRDTLGNPIEGVEVESWETDSTGHYDVQYEDRAGPDGRCIVKSDSEGRFWFKAIKPVSYSIPNDGPVGRLLALLHRHSYRPAHIHFILEKPGYNRLVTALFLRGDPYEKSDAVFGVKNSLLVDLIMADDLMAKKYQVKPGTPVLTYDFILVSEAEARDLREKEAKKALGALGRKFTMLNGLPVPDVD